MLAAIVHAFILAIGLILPLGVQNLFIFTQGMNRRWIQAVPIVITAAICDTLLILLAILGVSVLVVQFPLFMTLLKWIGFLFLLYIGWITWRTQSKIGMTETANPATQDHRKMGALILFTASISLLNPHAILDTIGVIGTSSLKYTDLSEKVVFTLTCIIVSWIWFFSLMTAGHLLGKIRSESNWKAYINKVSAVMVWLAAFYLVFS
jgi:L-lysine exporter family protein LysE/ArgO